MWKLSLTTSIAVLVLAGAVMARQQGVRTVATDKDVMTMFTVPSSDAIFNILEAPATDEGWSDARKNGVILAESGNLLLIGDRAQKTGDWAAQAKSLVDAGAAIVQAADKKDFDALTAGSDAAAETCINCHNQYMKK